MTQARTVGIESHPARELNQVVTHSASLFFGCLADFFTSGNT